MSIRHQRSPLALAILALLGEEAMHPYRMQQLLNERGKYEVINIRQRASIYQVIERLVRSGLISVRETVRVENRPERTIYEITGAGREVLMGWMREILSAPARQFPEFPAAVSFLPLLSPEETLGLLDARASALGQELGRLDGVIREAAGVPRLFLLEMEYLRALVVAELEWVRSVSDELRSGTLTWSEQWLREISASFADSPAGDRGKEGE